MVPVEDLWGTLGAPPRPPRPKIFSISYSFSQNLSKSYVGAPPPPRAGAPSYGKSWIRPWVQCTHIFKGNCCLKFKLLSPISG